MRNPSERRTASKGRAKKRLPNVGGHQMDPRRDTEGHAGVVVVAMVWLAFYLVASITTAAPSLIASYGDQTPGRHVAGQSQVVRNSAAPH